MCEGSKPRLKIGSKVHRSLPLDVVLRGWGLSALLRNQSQTPWKRNLWWNLKPESENVLRISLKIGSQVLRRSLLANA